MSKRAPRVLVLLKRTSYAKLVEDERDARVVELLARKDPTVRSMMRTHDDHQATVAEVRQGLAELGAEAEVVHGARARVLGRFALVVTVGGDGTLLAASHSVGGETPVLGVNSAPNSSVGFFCAARKGTVRESLAAALEGRMPGTVLSRLRVDRNGVVLHARVLNEVLYCHASPAATSKYILRVRAASGRSEHEEEQRSSGMWIGTAAGSTAAQRSAGGQVLPLTSTDIQFVVREPYVPLKGPPGIAQGRIPAGEELLVRNKMKEAKLYIDGHHNVYDAAIGDVLTFRRSEEPLTVLGLNVDSRDGK
jgi:NAD+ kinase